MSALRFCPSLTCAGRRGIAELSFIRPIHRDTLKGRLPSIALHRGSLRIYNSARGTRSFSQSWKLQLATKKPSPPAAAKKPSPPTSAKRTSPPPPRKAPLPPARAYPSQTSSAEFGPLSGSVSDVFLTKLLARKSPLLIYESPPQGGYITTCYTMAAFLFILGGEIMTGQYVFPLPGDAPMWLVATGMISGIFFGGFAAWGLRNCQRMLKRLWLLPPPTRRGQAGAVHASYTLRAESQRMIPYWSRKPWEVPLREVNVSYRFPVDRLPPGVERGIEIAADNDGTTQVRKGLLARVASAVFGPLAWYWQYTWRFFGGAYFVRVSIDGKGEWKVDPEGKVNPATFNAVFNMAQKT